MDHLLLETLRDAQRFGFFGARPVEQAADHAEGFVTAIGPLDADARIVDLGSGGGLPGLVVAAAYPDAAITLVDRREKRTDFLRRAVRRLGWEHVEVMTIDAAVLAREVAAGDVAPFDAVTARGFGPPDLTLRVALQLAAASGVVVISEPPTDDRWDADLLVELGVERARVGVVSRFTRR